MAPDDLIFDDEIPWRVRAVREGVFSVTPSTADEAGVLYADLVELEQRLASVTADLATYRELAQTALDLVTSLTVRLTQANGRLAQQAEQIRALMRVDEHGRTCPRGGHSAA